MTNYFGNCWTIPSQTNADSHCTCTMLPTQYKLFPVEVWPLLTGSGKCVAALTLPLQQSYFLLFFFSLSLSTLSLALWLAASSSFGLWTGIVRQNIGKHEELECLSHQEVLTWKNLSACLLKSLEMNLLGVYLLCSLLALRKTHFFSPVLFALIFHFSFSSHCV